MRQLKYLCLALAILLLLTGCGGAADQPGSAGEIRDGSVPASDGRASDESFVPYKAPDFRDAQFHKALAEGEGDNLIDVSAVADGYVAVSAVSEKRLKFQVVKDDFKYNYDISSDGAPSVFPLQSGSGTYMFRILENTTESKYAERYSVTRDVVISDEFQPFVRPSDYVNYTQKSECVKKAGDFAGKSRDALEVVSMIYDFICSSVTYDMEKAETVQSGYLPDPDETMGTGKGICFDYASLAAAMMRSQGIPAKVVFGYVSPKDLYHAWNMFYTEQTGWVTVSYEVSRDTWNRLDLTFSANGSDDSFIGNGENYKELYFY